VDVKPHIEPGDRWLQGWTREHELYAEIVTGTRAPTATGEHGREVQAILDAMYRSSEEGREVEVG
jgi:predicted dehydrogenase